MRFPGIVQSIIDASVRGIIRSRAESFKNSAMEVLELAADHTQNFRGWLSESEDRQSTAALIRELSESAINLGVAWIRYGKAVREVVDDTGGNGGAS